MPQWNEIRDGLRSSDTEAIRKAIVRVGRIHAEDLPADIADVVISLFRHPDPRVRVEAVRAIGLHWRIARAYAALVELLQRDEDWHVQLSTIDALGAIGREHPDIGRSVSKVLAGVALNERFAQDERMVAYLELLHVDGRIGPKEYRVRDRGVTESLASFEKDRAWVEQLALKDCL